MNTRKSRMVVIVAALGYYVDAFDLILFGVVKNPSLVALGYSGILLNNLGRSLLNYQMIGMLVGGLFWGIMGDKLGRKSVLFASILLYSLANIANGFVQNIDIYFALRFIAGVGLAGELGIGVTLATESLSRSKRGLGPMVIAIFGALGALSAPLLLKILNANAIENSWRMAYFIGGGLGLILLVMRLSIAESDMFKAIAKHNDRGNFLNILTNGPRFKKYIYCILLGLPIWFIINTLAINAPEIAKVLKINGQVNSGDCIMYMYMGLALGDLLCGLLSQILKSRKKPILLYLILTYLASIYYLMLNGQSNTFFYTVCFFLGLFGGYWALFIVVSAEQFGTNLRATVTTSVPNFVRGAVVPINMAVAGLSIYLGLIWAVFLVGTLCFVLAIWANFSLQESFHKHLDYVE